MIGVNGTALQILQRRLDNMIYMNPAALGPTSRHNYDEAKGPMGQEPRLKTDSYEGRNGTDNCTDNTYIIDKILGQIGSGTFHRYVPTWSWYRKTESTAKPPTTHLRISPRRTGDDLTDGERGNHNRICLNNEF